MKKDKTNHKENDSSNLQYRQRDHKRHARFIREFFHHSMMRGHGNRVHSKVENDNLVVQLVLPGVVKSSIRVRAKIDKLEVNAVHKDEVFLFPHNEAHKILDLENEVIPENAEALYSDGILTVTFRLADPQVAEISQR
ncbi:MAG: Hsp20/alpha crystallin family protein [Candidatus Kariarchaeaceae archaeon]|jgi:HSP20 family molecular chaperone IbpA